MEKVDYYCRGMKQYIRKEMLKELHLMPSNVRSIVIDNRRATATKKRFQCLLIKHAKPPPLLNSQTSKKGLPTFMLCDTLDATPTGSDLFKEQDPESHWHSLDSEKVDLEGKEVLILESFPITNDLHKSLQQHDLLGPPLPQEQQQAPSGF